MLRLRHIALGQDYQSQQEQIIHAVPPCFMSRDIIPAVDTSMQLAQSAQLDAGGSVINPFHIPSDVAQIIHTQMSEAYWKLSYWRTRLMAEDPQKQYCVGKTDGQDSNDHYQLVQALVEPVAVLYSQAGAEDTKRQATSQLMADLSSPTHWLPNLKDFIDTEIPTWAKVMGGVAAAAVVLIAVKRVAK